MADYEDYLVKSIFSDSFEIKVILKIDNQFTWILIKSSWFKKEKEKKKSIIVNKLRKLMLLIGRFSFEYITTFWIFYNAVNWLFFSFSFFHINFFDDLWKTSSKKSPMDDNDNQIYHQSVIAENAVSDHIFKIILTAHLTWDKIIHISQFSL